MHGSERGRWKHDLPNPWKVGVPSAPAVYSTPNGNAEQAGGQWGNASLTWDFENRLLSATGNHTSLYNYDADGNRIAQTVDNTLTTYLLDTNTTYARVLAEQSGASLTQYDYGDDLVRMSPAAGAYYYYIYDGLGSTRQLVDGTGASRQTYNYDAYGEPSAVNTGPGALGTEFLFNGQQYDPATHLYYLRARYYAPFQGRFLSQDPYAGSSEDPLSLHRYLYAAADPLDFFDPSGRDLCDTLVAIGAGLSLAARIMASPVVLAIAAVALNPGAANAPGLNDRLIPDNSAVRTAEFLLINETAGRAVGYVGRSLFKIGSAMVFRRFMSQFADGGSWIMTADQYDKFVLGRDVPYAGRLDGQFIAPKEAVDEAWAASAGDPAELGRQLGVPGWDSSTKLVRIDVYDPWAFNPRMPDAGLSGANGSFVPGGFTSGGVPEIVVDPIPIGSYRASPLN